MKLAEALGAHLANLYNLHATTHQDYYGTVQLAVKFNTVYYINIIEWRGHIIVTHNCGSLTNVPARTTLAPEDPELITTLEGIVREWLESICPKIVAGFE